MEQNKTVVTTTTVGERGRLMLPVQVQRATHLSKGDTVAIRTAEDGTITIQPLRVVAHRLRRDLLPLLAGHLPTAEARLHAGGRGVDAEHLEPIGPPLQPLPPPPGRFQYGPAIEGDKRAVFTAGAVLAWLGGGPFDVADRFLPTALLPEAAATELVTLLARAGAHQHADRLLTDLGLLGVRRPAATEHRATLAEDTAIALELTTDAARHGYEVSLPDALCAAAAVRLDLPLIAADLLQAADERPLTGRQERDANDADA